jgi:hypothetical protein
VGVPIGLHFGAEVGVFALAGFLAGRLGAESLAAHQIALTFSSVTFTFALGIGNAGSVRVGLASARETRRARGGPGCSPSAQGPPSWAARPSLTSCSPGPSSRR